MTFVKNALLRQMLRHRCHCHGFKLMFALVTLCLFMLSALLFSSVSFAATYSVSDSEGLKAQLAQSRLGDSILLRAGIYSGQFEIHHGITLTGEKGAVIDAQGLGSAITIFVSDVTISNLEIQNWGGDLYERNSGILIQDLVHRTKIESNRLTGRGFGVCAENSANITVSDNIISGDPERHKLDRGDGIYLKRVESPVIEGNKIFHVRDGVYIEAGKHSLIFDNQFSEQQYGIHYMYSKRDEAYGNEAVDVDGGYALMSSEEINLYHNRVSRAKEFGVLLNMTHNSVVSSNRVSDAHNPQGKVELGNEGKGIFVYGALDNEIKNNLFATSDIGIYMAMGGEGNLVYGNQFVNNRTQVKYVGEQLLEWSRDSRGNYWSGYMGWDSNRDGIADNPYRPNDGLDKLFWLYPEARFLMNSPVVALLRWVQSQFEFGEPNGIVDSFPLISADME
ncbi:nitrous oxide reductase family maturation protein NosD [Shewanella canadensis]|uniref:nitrous oxide reductase family maturation protein NosD n=1 Tax=Shewanella canadensis TaxID=271096 RepID=UPI001FE54731|nr:nitrous oxide reductase family maturation protein NosD [Shewanella canadensis]